MEKLVEDYYWRCVNAIDKGMQPSIVFVGTFLINPVPFMGLEPGDKVVQIGAKVGGSATVNRIDQMLTFVTYRGIRREETMNGFKPSDLLIFELNKNERPVGINEPVYIAYIIIEADGFTELKVPDIRYNVNRIYKPFFLKKV